MELIEKSRKWPKFASDYKFKGLNLLLRLFGYDVIVNDDEGESEVALEFHLRDDLQDTLRYHLVSEDTASLMETRCAFLDLNQVIIKTKEPVFQFIDVINALRLRAHDAPLTTGGIRCLKCNVLFSRSTFRDQQLEGFYISSFRQCVQCGCAWPRAETLTRDILPRPGTICDVKTLLKFMKQIVNEEKLQGPDADMPPGTRPAGFQTISSFINLHCQFGKEVTSDIDKKEEMIGIFKFVARRVFFIKLLQNYGENETFLQNMIELSDDETSSSWGQRTPLHQPDEQPEFVDTKRKMLFKYLNIEKAGNLIKPQTKVKSARIDQPSTSYAEAVSLNPQVYDEEDNFSKLSISTPDITSRSPFKKSPVFKLMTKQSSSYSLKDLESSSPKKSPFKSPKSHGKSSKSLKRSPLSMFSSLQSLTSPGRESSPSKSPKTSPIERFFSKHSAASKERLTESPIDRAISKRLKLSKSPAKSAEKLPLVSSDELRAQEAEKRDKSCRPKARHSDPLPQRVRFDPNVSEHLPDNLSGATNLPDHLPDNFFEATNISGYLPDSIPGELPSTSGGKFTPKEFDSMENWDGQSVTSYIDQIDELLDQVKRIYKDTTDKTDKLGLKENLARMQQLKKDILTTENPELARDRLEKNNNFLLKGFLGTYQDLVDAEEMQQQAAKKFEKVNQKMIAKIRKAKEKVKRAYEGLRQGETGFELVDPDVGEGRSTSTGRKRHKTPSPSKEKSAIKNLKYSPL